MNMEGTSQLRRRASDFVLKGKYKRAAQLYERILRLEPRDAQSAHRLGELRRRLGDFRGAQMSYWRAAELFRAAGLEEKANAVEAVMSQLTAEAASASERAAGATPLARLRSFLKIPTT